MTAREVRAGDPARMGVTPEGGGVNAAVWAPEARAVWLCLFDEHGREERIALPHEHEGVWHAWVGALGPGARYGLRAEGDFEPERGLRFDARKLLIDPWARSVEAPLRWHPAMNSDDPRDSAPFVAKCVVMDAAPTLAASTDPAANRPGRAWGDTVIYEAHVKGLTALHPAVPEELRGTYLGMAHPAVIAHLSALGITAVELLPVQTFLDDRHVTLRGLRNYWGYQPIGFFAPEPRYAHRDADAELRALVHALHEAGIEVILDVVFNHSGEGDAHGPTLSMRGLHNRGYYRLGPDGAEQLRDSVRYLDDAGTGNTLNLHEPQVRHLVLDSLRHWAGRYGVDGFRFDLATMLGRNPHDFDPAAPFFTELLADPELSRLKLIAEPWDIGPGGYQRGSFPPPLAEWNDRFRDGVRRAWRGDGVAEPGVSELGTALLGSADVFDRAGRSAAASINFLTAHDGFTLADLVSYERKHNDANGEQGRDGHDENYSDNLGVEGPSDDPTILASRGRRVRAMLSTLFVAQGVPMLLAGDELGNSQGGNNNAYAQDNETSWLDWVGADAALLAFTAQLIALRHRLTLLRQSAFLHGTARGDGLPDIEWLLPDGRSPGAHDWHDPAQRTICALLRGAAGDVQGEALDAALLIVLNTGDDVDVELPRSRRWWLDLDSARPRATGPVSARYLALAQSVAVLSAG